MANYKLCGVMVQQPCIGLWPPVLQVLRQDVLHGEVVSPFLSNPQPGGQGLYICCPPPETGQPSCTPRYWVGNSNYEPLRANCW